MKDWEFINYIKKVQSSFKKKKCLCESMGNCNGGIIRSHSIQHKRALEKIATNNHVAGFIMNPNYPRTSDYFVLNSNISINEASTFYGVCKEHDEKLFHCIDDFDIMPTPEQVLSITYRTMIRELYQKNASAESNTIVDDLILKIEGDFQRKKAEQFIDEFQLGTIIGVEELHTICYQLSNDIEQKNYNNLEYFLFRLRDYPKIMSSGSCMPDCDYEGNEVNNLVYPPRWFAINIFSDSNNGIILFSWQKGNQIISFLKSLLSQEDYLNKIIELVFSHIENTFFEISWWDSLKVIKKSRIQKMLFNNTPHGGSGIRKNNLKYLDFELVEKKTNCEELMMYC